MQVDSTTYIASNELSEQEIEVKFKLNWFDQLIGRSNTRIFVKRMECAWVEKETGRDLSFFEAILIADVLDGSQFGDL